MLIILTFTQREAAHKGHMFMFCTYLVIKIITKYLIFLGKERSMIKKIIETISSHVE
jgi:hypothetical protein